MLIDTRYKLPFYAHYNLMINFQELNSIPTCGVNVTRKGMNFYYNTEFLNKLPQEEVNFIDIHEIFHLLFNHPKRTVSGRYDPHLANVAQDMLINSIIWSDINHGFVQIPKDEKGRNMALFLPNEYEGEEIFEPLYEWLMVKKKEHDDKKKENECKSCNGTGEKQEQDQNGEGGEGDNGENGEGNGKGSGKDSKGNPEYGDYGKAGGNKVDTYSLDSIFDNLKETEGQYMDSHIEDTVPEELRETMVKEAFEKLKARGLADSKEVTAILNKLRKNRKDYLKEIKRSVSNIIGAGNKQKTITRLNRRGIKGLKGSKKVKSKINVILDTSGSMGGMFEKVLSYIFQRDITINLLQVDTVLRGTEDIKNMRDLERLKIRGGGGTRMQPGIDYICENYNQYNTVLLTDGWVDSLDWSNHNGKVLILTTADECPITRNPKKSLKQIWIDTKYD